MGSDGREAGTTHARARTPSPDLCGRQARRAGAVTKVDHRRVLEIKVVVLPEEETEEKDKEK